VMSGDVWAMKIYVGPVPAPPPSRRTTSTNAIQLFKRLGLPRAHFRSQTTYSHRNLASGFGWPQIWDGSNFENCRIATTKILYLKLGRTKTTADSDCYIEC
jgi:hypothetical protein